MNDLQTRAEDRAEKQQNTFRNVCARHDIDHLQCLEFSDLFVQPLPYHSVKKKRYGVDDWRTIHGALSRARTATHLAGIISAASLGKWYPSYGLYDIDSRDRGEVDEIRKANGFTDSNSILSSSESKDSYHLLFRPVYRGKPMTASLYSELSSHVEERHSIEVYPKSRHVIRLPFGKHFTPIDIKYEDMKGIELLKSFLALQEYEMFGRFPFRKNKVERMKNLFNADDSIGRTPGWYEQGEELFKIGLVDYSTRYNSQARVIYHLMRQNYSKESCIDTVIMWIKQKHHNLSKEVKAGRWAKVYREIESQANYIYANYEQESYLPDTTQKSYMGFISKTQIIEIVKMAGGNLPRAKFIIKLMMFMNPRRERRWIRVHSDLLTEWSQKNYIKYLNEMESMNLIKRNHSYMTGEFSKSITPLPQFKSMLIDSHSNPILIDNRTPEDHKELIQTSFTAREYRDLLKESGLDKPIMQVKGIFGSKKVKKV